MTAQCKEIEALLERKWDGETLLPEEVARLDGHLARCSACVELARDVGGVLDVATSMRDLTYDRPIELAPMVLAPRRAQPGLLWVMGFGWVAAALLVGLFLGRGTQAPGPTSTEREVLVRFAVPVAASKSVEVVGDFTGWRDRIPLTANADGMWIGQVRMEPGRYHYVIVVDGEQMLVDPSAPQVVDDGFGGKNSVLDVGSI